MRRIYRILGSGLPSFDVDPNDEVNLYLLNCVFRGRRASQDTRIKALYSADRPFGFPRATKFWSVLLVDEMLAKAIGDVFLQYLDLIPFEVVNVSCTYFAVTPLLYYDCLDLEVSEVTYKRTGEIERVDRPVLRAKSIGPAPIFRSDGSLVCINLVMKQMLSVENTDLRFQAVEVVEG